MTGEYNPTSDIGGFLGAIRDGSLADIDPAEVHGLIDRVDLATGDGDGMRDMYASIAASDAAPLIDALDSEDDLTGFYVGAPSRTGYPTSEVLDAVGAAMAGGDTSRFDQVMAAYYAS